MKSIKTFITATLLMCSASLAAQEPAAPTMTHVFTIHAQCEGAYEVGTTAMGKRFIIPIVGGYFEGPAIKGTVLPGGADYQLVDTLRNRTHLEAIYSIRTDDGVNIHVRNTGVLANPTMPDGSKGFYFVTTPVFEAPIDSKYAWLNDAVFVCTPFFEEGYIGLKMWKAN